MTGWIAQTLAGSAVLMLVVLVVRRPVAKAFGARLGYALWLLPALRMVLPPRPAFPILPAVGPAPLPFDPAGPPPELLPPELTAALAVPPDVPGLPWVALLMALWLAGAAAWFGWQLLRYRRFVGEALRRGELLGREVAVEIVMSPAVTGPVAAGVVRRRIFLPCDFMARYTAAERRQALLHEGAHHDRHDLLANLAALAVVALHWWNPIAHIAFRAFRSDQELACDATVLASADAQARYAYGSALAKSSGAPVPAGACALDNAAEIKRRLRMIKRGRIGGARVAGGALLLLAVAAVGLAGTASQSAPTVPLPIAMVEPLPVAMPAPVPLPAPLPPAPAPASPAPVVAPPRVAEAVIVDDRRVHEEVAAALAAAAQARRYAFAQAPRAREESAMIRQDALVAAAQARAGAQAEAARFAQVALAQARARLVGDCAALGRPVAAGEGDWGSLAMCDKAAFRAEVRKALADAREQLSRTPWPNAAERERARETLDRAVEQFDGRSG